MKGSTVPSLQALAVLCQAVCDSKGSCRARVGGLERDSGFPRQLAFHGSPSRKWQGEHKNSIHSPKLKLSEYGSTFRWRSVMRGVCTGTSIV